MTKRDTDRSSTVSRIVQHYVHQRPSVKECLQRGLVNYSALAREICEVEGVKQFDAVLAACRRLRPRLRGLASHEKAVTKLVKEAKLGIRSRMIVAILEKQRAMERVAQFQLAVRGKRGDITTIEGETSITIITNESHADLIRTSFRSAVRKLTSGVAQITMLFPERIEHTPGVVAHIYNLVRERSVNILEEASCWTDLMLVVNEEDLAATLAALESHRS